MCPCPGVIGENKPGSEYPRHMCSLVEVWIPPPSLRLTEQKGLPLVLHGIKVAIREGAQVRWARGGGGRRAGEGRAHTSDEGIKGGG